MDPLSDEKLIKSCLSGNQGHCALIWRRYNRYIFSIIWKWVKDEELAKDLTQETFLRVFRGLKGFRGETLFKNWLAKIAVNICIDHNKKSKRRHKGGHISIDDLEDTINNYLADNKTADDQLEQLLRKELGDVIINVIGTLGKDHQETIMLSLTGHTYDEISEITKVSKDTVGSRIHYAKMKLRKLLMPYLMTKKRKK